ncbi:MAG: DsrE family protein [Lentimicrobiaceae bacterium]|jgi:predicted peroxiredoxin
MKKLCILLLIVAGFFTSCSNKGSQDNSNTGMSAANHEQADKKDAVRDGVLIHITHASDDPHRAVMPLKMATMMSEDKDVLVYLDIKGIELVLKDAKDVTYPTFPSAQESLKILIDRGIPVYACPGCMKAAGKTADDLIPGVKMAEKEAFFTFTKGRIITLDY